MHRLKYLTVLSIPLVAFFAFQQTGIWSFATVLFVFGLLPLLELIINPNAQNMSETQEALAKHDKVYDWLIYLVFPIHLFAMGYFLVLMKTGDFDSTTATGHIFSFGILCGVFGINVAHELGHRSDKMAQNMAKILLSTSMYMHFFIEHNRGHHKHVATPNDPSTARFGEIIYFYWPRTIIGSYISAWKIENRRLAKAYLPWYHFSNEMLQFQLIQLSILVFIFLFGGWKLLGAYGAAALIGILLLETVQYIEHYGLLRKQTSSNSYERVLPAHSWNSDHVLGRLMLFELTRHSDHHYLASRKYQILRHMDESPQMPTGYPGMMVLSLIPPLFFWVMHRIMDNG